jgi:uncharacterized protein YdeI (YjbR/CyaY-like superfamily)
MPDPNLKKVVSFARPQELAKWLQEHHATESELWIKIFKKHTGTPSVTWDDVVIESLCWGWIDGIKKSVDEQSYLQRITPRKSRSNWSKRNRQHVERLIQEGRMTPFGLLHVDAAKADGRWENAYSVSEMEVPEDFLAALELKPNAQQFYANLTKSNRYVIAHGLLSAKRPETRQKRFAKYLGLLARNQKPT